MKLTFVIVFVITTTIVHGYSTGAPVEVCDDMKPKHPYEPQTSALPYQVTVDKDQIKATDKVKITITGKKPFKGFLVQVRKAGNAAAVGSFSVDKAIGKTIDCGHSKAAVTHNNDSNKTGVTLEWTPSADAAGVYTVYVTVAEDGAIFWVKQATAQMTIK